MKRANLILAVLIAIFVFTNISAAQKIKKSTKLKPYVTITPGAGIIFPVGTFADGLKEGLHAGLDIGYRINKEVGFYAKFGYSNLSSKVEVTGVEVPSAQMLEFSGGPRYFLTNPKLSSTLFLEGGVGGYVVSQDAYNTSTASVLEVSSTKFGVNAGIGANLAVSDNIDIMLKTKYHNVFAEGGSNSFITAIGGLEFKIR